MRKKKKKSAIKYTFNFFDFLYFAIFFNVEKSRKIVFANKT